MLITNPYHAHHKPKLLKVSKAQEALRVSSAQDVEELCKFLTLLKVSN